MAKTINNKKIIIISVIVVLVIVAIVAYFVFNKPNKAETIEQQSNYTRDLSKVQAEIDAQQKVIDKINEELKPLLEERTELEQKIKVLSENNKTN